MKKAMPSLYGRVATILLEEFRRRDSAPQPRTSETHFSSSQKSKDRTEEYLRSGRFCQGMLLATDPSTSVILIGLLPLLRLSSIDQ